MRLNVPGGSRFAALAAAAAAAEETDDLDVVRYGDEGLGGLELLAEAGAARAAAAAAPPVGLTAAAQRRDMGVVNQAGHGPGKQLLSPTGYPIWRQSLFKLTINSQSSFPREGGDMTANADGVTFYAMERALKDLASLIGRRVTRALFVSETTFGSPQNVLRVEVTSIEELQIERGERMSSPHVQLNIIVSHTFCKYGGGRANYGPRLDLGVLKGMAINAMSLSLGDPAKGRTYGGKVCLFFGVVECASAQFAAPGASLLF